MALPLAAAALSKFGGGLALRRGIRALGGTARTARRFLRRGGRRRGRRVSISRLMFLQAVLGKGHPAVKLAGFKFAGIR